MRPDSRSVHRLSVLRQEVNPRKDHAAANRCGVAQIGREPPFSADENGGSLLTWQKEAPSAGRALWCLNQPFVGVVDTALLMDLTYLAFRYAQASLYQISYQAPSSVSSETPMTATTVSVGIVMRTSLLVEGAERTFTSFVVAMLSAFGVMTSSCTSVGHLAVSRSGVPPRWLDAKIDATVQLLLVTSMATCPL